MDTNDTLYSHRPFYTQNMHFVEGYVNCNLKPTEVTDSQWLYEQTPNIAQKYPPADGKWMQFYHISHLDTMWNYAKAKYRAGTLKGISSMKVSTAWRQQNDRSSSHGVIIFYCGPSKDRAKIMYYGRKLLEEIPYKDPSEWMSYKSNKQTLNGTRATGQKRNYLYRLRCSKY